MKRRDFVRGAVAAGAGLALGERLSASSWGMAPPARTIRLDDGWQFHLGDAADTAWESVRLPHTARVEALVTGPPGSDTYQWQGICWYRRTLRLDPADAGRKVFVHFEAAMNVAEVSLDGEPVARHLGGFLPFVIDLTDRLSPGRDAVLAVRLDNRDNPITGPKPLHLLDFNTYHGLYRYVHLVVKDRLHITDPILAGRPAAGGVFFTCLSATPERAEVRVQTHIRNDHARARRLSVRTTLVDADGREARSPERLPVDVGAGQDELVVQQFAVANPRLWSPASPHLYTLRVELVVDGQVVDAEETRVGIRRIHIGRDGFSINGQRMFLRGTNRHQEYPYVGYAVPEDAQYRDAKKIKEAGFDYIRLSHYPHAPAFMDACDQLGLVVMNCIPGWQYFGEDPAFAQLQYQNCRDLVRRDRNRPSVILWEVSLNETAMPPEFVARTHAIAHEELPGDQCYTCGWTRGYDVFIQARQHGGCTRETEHPCVVSEYGDWEYYAMTAGLNQESFQALSPAESNSRQLRWQGERAQLQQAANFQEAHNDNRATIAFADGLWVMYDYNRGYSPDLESSGCMDLFRLPKYAYHFFRSQRPAGEGAAMVFIASEWSAQSATAVRVFSNCEQVELRLNGRVVERRAPDRDRMSTRLAHPPFTFGIGGFTPGLLEAVGFIGGAPVARHTVRTAAAVERLALSLDLSGRPVARQGDDVLFGRASLLDGNGTVVASAWENVAFGTAGAATAIGANPFSSDAGIASIVVRTRSGTRDAALYAVAVVRSDGAARVLHDAVAVRGTAPAYAVHVTADGTAPTPSSPRYRGALREGPVRAAVVVGGRVVASIDERAEKFRLRGSAPHDAPREEFRHG